MAAERNPLGEASMLSKPLEWLTRWSLRAPTMVLGGVLAVSLVCILVTISNLTFKSDRLDLLNPASSYNIRWLNFMAEFGNRDDAVIVVQGKTPRLIAAAVEDLAAELAQQPKLFESVLYQHDLSRIQAKGLHLAAEKMSLAELHQLEEKILAQTEQLPPGVGEDPAGVLAKLNIEFQNLRPADTDSRERLVGDYSRLAGFLLPPLIPGDARAAATAESPPSELNSLLAEMRKLAPQPITTKQGRVGLVALKLVSDSAANSQAVTGIPALRQVLDSVRPKHPDVWLGLTGMPVIEYDEMQASQVDMIWTNVISLIGVALLFAAGYGGLRHAGLAVLVLLVGMIWSFGFVTLAVGHLNILSAAFGVILIGLGIDFGIHYIACYLRLRRLGVECGEALIQTAADVGPGVMTGGVTTAAAFFMAGLTEFTGVRELGIVAGGGILLCVLATIIALPPLVYLADRNRATTDLPTILPAASWFQISLKSPRFILSIAFLGTLVLGSGVLQLKYDHNLLNLQPKHVESVDIEQKLFSDTDDSVWFAVSMCQTREELRQRKAAFSQLSTVAKTEEIVSLLPVASAERAQVIANLHRALTPLAASLEAGRQATSLEAGRQATSLEAGRQATSLEAGRQATSSGVGREGGRPGDRVSRLEQEVIAAQKLLIKDALPFERPAMEYLEKLLQLLAQDTHEVAEAKLSRYRQNILSGGLSSLAELARYTDPTPPDLADLPPELVDRFVGQTSKHLLKVYAKGDIWDMENLKTFVDQVEQVDKVITGHPIQTYYASRHMQESYIHAGIYALIVVFALLMLDFRSVRHSALAMIPLAIGFVQMCGAIGWLGIPFNPANMIVLPLILGIGVDDGVHLVHEYRRQRGKFKLSDSTAVAVLLTSTTTMASFGSMILARHQGLRSLGQVLTLGVMFCLVASIVVFPAVLSWLTRNRRETEGEEEQDLRLAGAEDGELNSPDEETAGTSQTLEGVTDYKYTAKAVVESFSTVAGSSPTSPAENLPSPPPDPWAPAPSLFPRRRLP